jgi:hypothetical protein
VTAGGAILQNELNRKLPAAFLSQFPQGIEVAIPIIPMLSQPFKDQVRNAFAEALKVVWRVTLGIALAGFLCSLGMRQLRLHTNIDEEWGRKYLPTHSTQQLIPPEQTANKREAQEV